MNPQLWGSSTGLSTPICARTVPKGVLENKFIVFKRKRGQTLGGVRPRLGSDPYGIGAGTKNRTRDLLITNQLLYQLSYAGNMLLTSSKIYLITVNVGFLAGFSATTSA